MAAAHWQYRGPATPAPNPDNSNQGEYCDPVAAGRLHRLTAAGVPASVWVVERRQRLRLRNTRRLRPRSTGRSRPALRRCASAAIASARSRATRVFITTRPRRLCAGSGRGDGRLAGRRFFRHPNALGFSLDWARAVCPGLVFVRLCAFPVNLVFGWRLRPLAFRLRGRVSEHALVPPSLDRAFRRSSNPPPLVFRRSGAARVRAPRLGPPVRSRCARRTR